MRILKLIFFTYQHIEILFREENLNQVIGIFESQKRPYKIYDLNYASPESFGLDPQNTPCWVKKEQRLDTVYFNPVKHK